MTKIDVISGFLGAGKTTFIKKLLGQAIHGEKVVLIENEFGEIGIDGGFLKDSGVEIREMNSGCICCSLVGDFGKALQEVIETYRPERVIIEPSGVGKLSDVMDAVRKVAKDQPVKLNSAVTVVDALKSKMYMKNFGEFFNNQIQYAGTVVLSRTDLADSQKVGEAAARIRELNEAAVIITTPLDQLEGGQLLSFIEQPDTMMADLLQEVKADRHGHHHDRQHEGGCGCGGHGHGHHEHHHDEECGCGGHGHEHHGHEHHEKECGCGGHGHGHHEHHHDEECGCGGHSHGHGHHEKECGCGGHGHEHHEHHAEEIFSSWGIETAVPCTRAELEEICGQLADSTVYGEVLRAKGMLPTEKPGEWLYFDLVPEQYEIRVEKPDYTGKVCVIGARLNEEKLNQAFGRSK